MPFNLRSAALCIVTCPPDAPPPLACRYRFNRSLRPVIPRFPPSSNSNPIVSPSFLLPNLPRLACDISIVIRRYLQKAQVISAHAGSPIARARVVLLPVCTWQSCQASPGQLVQCPSDHCPSNSQSSQLPSI